MDFFSFADDFGVVRRRCQSLIVDECKEYKINYSQFSFLVKLYEMEGCNQDAMVNALCIDKASVTRVIKQMEELGLVYREIDNIDRRVKRLYLTEKGKDMEPEIKRIVTDLIKYLVDAMDPEMVKIAMDSMNQAAQLLKKADGKAVFGK